MKIFYGSRPSREGEAGGIMWLNAAITRYFIVICWRSQKCSPSDLVLLPCYHCLYWGNPWRYSCRSPPAPSCRCWWDLHCFYVAPVWSWLLVPSYQRSGTCSIWNINIQAGGSCRAETSVTNVRIVTWTGINLIWSVNSLIVTAGIKCDFYLPPAYEWVCRYWRSEGKVSLTPSTPRHSPARDIGSQNTAGLRLTVGRVDQNVEPGQKVQQLERQRLAPAEECGLVGESEGLLGGIKLMIKGLPGPGPSQVEMLLRRDWV